MLSSHKGSHCPLFSLEGINFTHFFRNCSGKVFSQTFWCPGFLVDYPREPGHFVGSMDPWGLVKIEVYRLVPRHDHPGPSPHRLQ